MEPPDKRITSLETVGLKWAFTELVVKTAYDRCQPRAASAVSPFIITESFSSLTATALRNFHRASCHVVIETIIYWLSEFIFLLIFLGRVTMASNSRLYPTTRCSIATHPAKPPRSASRLALRAPLIRLLTNYSAVADLLRNPKEQRSDQCVFSEIDD